MALLVHRLVEGANHLLIGARLGRHVLQYFGDGLAGDGDAVAMQQAGFEQDLHHLRNAASLVQIGRHVLA